jgi:type IV pilus assembly protein PilW
MFTLESGAERVRRDGSNPAHEGVRLRARTRARKCAQSGVSLVEWLVGIALGLLLIAAASKTVVLAHRISATASEAQGLQEQASYALRVIGQQVRQSGSLVIRRPAGADRFDFDRADEISLPGSTALVAGSDGKKGGPGSLTIANLPAAGLPVQQRNCLGETALESGRMDSTFTLESGQLMCSTTRTTAQKAALAQNVADLQFRYRVRSGAGVRVMSATGIEAAGLWPQVSAIEVCLDMRGSEGDYPAVGRYRNCAGQDVARDGHLHLIFRNVFSLRTQSGL